MIRFYIKCFFFIFLFSLGNTLSFAQTPTSCFEIESILVDACGSPEGENEMVRFKVGGSSLNTADMFVDWPSNSFQGICQDVITANAVSTLNSTVLGCGVLIEPTLGVLPAGANVLLVTSTAIDVNANSFANLNDTLYVIFQCVGNTIGHFANYSTGSGLRSLIISFSSPPACADTVTYDKVLLVNQSGGPGGTTAQRDGALANFDWPGNVTYANFGCQAPFNPASVNISLVSPVSICPGDSINLMVSVAGGIQSVFWQGNNGTFSSTTNDTTTYFSSVNDTSGFYIFVGGISICNDTILDSVLIAINPPLTSTQNPVICAGDSFALPGGSFVSSTGTYTDTLVATSGCDSIITTNLSTIAAITSTQNPAICAGGSYILPGGTVVTTSGTYTDTIAATSGCDSIITTNLSVIAPVTSTLNPEICAGDNYILPGGTAVSSAGTYTDTIVATSGCDSIITTNLTVNPQQSSTQNPVICAGDNFTLPGGLIVSTTGTYADTLTTFLGCDSIITTNLTVNPQPTPTQDPVICAGDNYTLPGGLIVSTTGTYADTLTTFLGCDSIITTYLTVNSLPTSSQDPIICMGGSFTLPGGAIVSTAGTYSDTLTAAATNGCDSIVNTSLTLSPALTFNQTFVGCQGFSVAVGSNVYNTTGTFTDTLSTLGGCDSIVTTGLTITTAGTTVQTLVECAGFSITVGSNTYTATGMYADILNSCDTVITKLTVNPNPIITLIKVDDNCGEQTGSVVAQVATNSPPLTYSWSTGNTDSLISNLPVGQYSVTITDGSGCSNMDSILIDDLNIDCSSFIYVPNVFTPNGDGNNDEFFLIGKGIKTLNLKIYNRWGNKVFETSDITQGWDGKYNGSDQNTAVFVYVLEVTYENGKPPLIDSGNINLVR